MRARRLFKAIRRLWYNPIRVYCFHIVNDVFDPEKMWDCDWIQTESFKNSILKISSKTRFISITEAQHLLKQKFIRIRKYSVLTFDDGSSSLVDIMPWIAEQCIPVTIFVNPGVLYGDLKRDNPMDLLTKVELKELVLKYPTYISIASHGSSHDDYSRVPLERFEKDVILAEESLAVFDNKVPFFAYPYGRHTVETDSFLRCVGLTPVYCDGQDNYNNPSIIHREVLMSKNRNSINE